MVKTQSSNFNAEWRNGNDSEMWRESLICIKNILLRVRKMKIRL